MGKLKLDLLKGIEEQEKAIDTSITNNKINDIELDESEPLEEAAKEPEQITQQQAASEVSPQPTRKKAQTNKKANGEQKISEMTNKSSDEITENISRKQSEESANEITTNTAKEKNFKKKFINFDITDIDRYLTAVAGIHGKSKTKYLHDLVVADMKAHPEIAALIRN